MERWCDRVALVTGGSSGVGAAVVRELVKHGMKVATCARRMDKLQMLTQSLREEPGEVMPIQCDLREESQIKVMFDHINAYWGGVDVCCNSAGVSLETPIVEADSQEWNTMMGVNLLAPCVCIRESVKSMKARGVDDGHIININSLSGHRVGRAHFYSVTKFALTALTDAIRWEMRNNASHIRVTQISPGLIKSEFHDINKSPEEVERLYANRQSLLPEDIAETVTFILSRPPHVQIHDILMRPTEQVP